MVYLEIAMKINVKPFISCYFVVQFAKQGEASKLVIGDLCHGHSRSPMSSNVIYLLQLNSPLY